MNRVTPLWYGGVQRLPPPNSRACSWKGVVVSVRAIVGLFESLPGRHGQRRPAAVEGCLPRCSSRTGVARLCRGCRGPPVGGTGSGVTVDVRGAGARRQLASVVGGSVEGVRSGARTVETVPELGVVLHAGETSAAHLDVVTRALRGLSSDATAAAHCTRRDTRHGRGRITARRVRGRCAVNSAGCAPTTASLRLQRQRQATSLAELG